MSIFNFFRRKQKTLVAAESNGKFRCIVSTPKEITASSKTYVDDLESALDYGKRKKCRNVLVLRSADLRELDVKLGHDLDAEDRKSAIEYAAANNSGDLTGTQRFAYLDGMLHDFRSGILVSAYDTEELIDFGKMVSSAKMKFRGVINYKQLLLANHFSDPAHHNYIFLFLMGNHGFAAIPDRNKLQIKNLPFGIPSSEDDEEYFSKAERRLSILLERKNVILYSPDATSTLCKKLQEISGAENISAANFNEEFNHSTLLFLNDRNSLIHPALPPEDPQDTKKSGTFIGIFLIIATVLSLLFLYTKNNKTRDFLNNKITVNAEKNSLIKGESDTLKKLEASLVAEKEIYQVLKQKEKVSKDFIVVANLLARYNLQYSRITSIEETAKGIYFSGESVHQPDLSNFFNHFEKQLNKFSLTLFSDGLSKEKNGKIIFRSHVSAGAGGK